jgi:3-hydroxybenzoate 6-monooxygenase
MNMGGQPIIVVGGGIGGLASATGLAKRGFHVIVLEAAPELGELGAGIQIGPNAFRCFDYLGVRDEARQTAIYINRLRLMDAMSGEEIVHIPLDDEFREKFENPYAVIHRGNLHGVFLRACRAHPLVDLRVASRVVSYDQDGKGVVVRLASGEEVRGSVLIGADGLWSSVRAQMIGDGPPVISGHTTYRSVIPTEQMPEDFRWNAATLWAGPKCHLVHYPLSDWKQFNLVATFHNDAHEAVAGVPVDIEEVLKGFAHTDPMVQTIIRHGADWKRWVLCDREPVTNWVDGRVALLGDAAHPMLQYLAQGACMAMEDAVSLTAHLSSMADRPELALASYCEARRLRTARVQLHSREMGQHIYHPAGAHALLRNQMLQSKTTPEIHDTLSWLYGLKTEEIIGPIPVPA